MPKESVLTVTFEQNRLVTDLATRLASIPGIKAVVLGGSHARGRALPSSDIDLGLLYSDSDTFSVESIRSLASDVNDSPDPVVTHFYGWGPWVNGGAWLTIGGQRVDLIYRSLEDIERVIRDSVAGRHELDYSQQPPFGFFSATYLGEIAVCVPLVDPSATVAALKDRVADFPDALRQAVVRDYLWAAEFSLEPFARKFASRSDTYGTVACLTRAVNYLILVLFALNRTYLINDKTAIAEIAEFERSPADFGSRVQKILAQPGASAEELSAAVDEVGRLLRETIDLTDGLYQARFILPK